MARRRSYVEDKGHLTTAKNAQSAERGSYIDPAFLTEEHCHVTIVLHLPPQGLSLHFIHRKSVELMSMSSVKSSAFGLK